MQCKYWVELDSSFLLLSFLLQPAPLPLVHQHVQLQVGLLPKLRSTLVARQLHPLLSCQLVGLPIDI